MSTRMEIEKAYKVMQAAWIEENNIKVGDTVKVVRDWGMSELGFTGADWSAHRENQIVKEIFDDSLCLSQSCLTPFFALEFVSHAPVAENMIEINGKKWSEATIAEALKKHAN